MKKPLFLFLTSLFVTFCVNAQQWAGSPSITDTVYRQGTLMIRPVNDSVGQPFVTMTNKRITLTESYKSTYSLGELRLSNDRIVIDRLVPADRSSTMIGRGSFKFYCSSPVKTFELSKGDLTTNGKIICTDSVVANNMKITNGLSVNGANSHPSYKITVNGGVLCDAVKIIANVPSSDYVFENDYYLKPLAEVEAYVKENKHLPEVPSAAEFKENGYKVGEMDDILLRKIEELTLYIIEQQKQIENLQKQINK